jgi:hypothetical protein
VPNVTWTLNPAVGTVSGSGLYTAPAAVASGQTITVTATSPAAQMGTATVNLEASLTISPSTTSLGPSGTQQFTTNVAVTWTLNPASGTIAPNGLYTAPASIAASQQVVLTGTSAAGQTTTATITLLTGASPGPSVVRVRAGGGPYTDSQGNSWAADFGYNGGNPYSTAAAIAATPDPVLYQTERWSATPLTYQFAVTNGTYTVTLKFSENYATAAGQRKFAIAINNQTLVSSFDIFSQAGGGFRAIDQVFSVPVSNGQLAITLTPVVGSPKIDAIQIVPGSGPALTVSPGTVSLSSGMTQQFTASAPVTWSISPLTGSISAGGLYTAPSSIAATQAVTVTATAGGGPAAVATITLLFSPGTSVIRVRAGGGTYTDSQGNGWSADFGYNGGNVFSTTAAIAATPDPALYQTERWSATALTYQFAVTNGTYTVTLKFSENYSTAAGQRKFDIVINNQTLVSSFDIFAQAGGGFHAIDQVFSVPVSNGQLTVTLNHVVGSPKIDAIQIVPGP